MKTSDDELKQGSSNVMLTGENISEENLNEEEELDFYDFLEAVSDKIDNIKNQIEERREHPRQRLRRTIAELEEQKRILKSQLEQRIHIWSENLKKPNFIRIRDKISFSIAVSIA
ncbi:unnamed protein product, partial [Rotaria sp. Silwood2]